MMELVKTALIFGWLLLLVSPMPLFGCEGDTLIGGGGDDTIIGSNCDDTIVGNDGNNTLTGRGGFDAFVFSTGYCTDLYCPAPPVPFWAAFGVSTIIDFVPGVDRIVLDKATFAVLQSDLGAGFSVAGEFHVVGSDAAVASDSAVIVYSTESRTLFYNENGSAAGLGQGAPFAALDDMVGLEAPDFGIVDYSPTVSIATTTTTPTETSTSTTTTTPSPHSTSTTTAIPVCASPACVLHAAIFGPTCEGRVPRRLAGMVRRAANLIASAQTVNGAKRARVLSNASHVLAVLEVRALKKAAGHHPAITVECAHSIAEASKEVVRRFTL
jgi:hypothetical protein